MAILTKAQLEALNQASFPDQSSEAITPAILRTYNTATIDTLVDSLDTGSFITDVSALNAFTASQLSINSGLNASTASQQISINSLNSNSASVNSSITQLNTETASLQSQLATIGTQSGSWGGGGTDLTPLNQATASLQAFTASAQISITALNASSASQQVSINALNTYTASASTASIVSSITQLNQATSSLQTFSASALIQLSNLNTTTASINSSITQLNASSASQQVSIDALNTTSASLNTSASLALVTASFNNSTRNLTFTKGDTSQFSVNIPDASGSAIPTGTVSSSAQILAYNIFATTGSNTFAGDQNINGRVNIIGGNALSVQANAQGSGSQYSNAQLVIDGDPANIYSAYQGVDNNNNGIFGVGINSYNPKDGGTATFWIGGGQSIGGDNTILTANPNNTNLQFWKPNTIFNGNVSVTGSLNVGGSPVIVSSQTGSFVTEAETGSFAKTTTANTFNGDQTISGSLLTNAGAIFGNATSQYNSLIVSSSLATYPGNLFNSIGIDTDGGGQWSAGMYISTYSSFGSNPQFGIYGGGTGNNGDNNVLFSYGNLIQLNKNTQINGTLSVSSSVGINSGSYNGKAVTNITPVSSSQSAVQNIVTLTTSEYALITPNSTTLYIVI